MAKPSVVVNDLDCPLTFSVGLSTLKTAMNLYAQQRRYFERAYETGEHGWPTTEPTPFVVQSIRKLMRQGELSRKGRVLDLGCGEGRHTFVSAEMGLVAIGLDYQPPAIARARSMSKAKSLHQECLFLVGDAFDLPEEEREGLYAFYQVLMRKKR